MTQQPTPDPSPTPESSPAIDAQLQQEIDAAMDDGSIDAMMESSLAASEEQTADAQGEATIAHDIRRGRIAAVRGEDVFVDLTGLDQGKMQGVVPGVQFERPPRVGAIMDFVVDRIDQAQGLVHLSREGAVSRTTWDQLHRGSNVEARVVGVNKGGLDLEMVGGVRAFMPASQVDLHHVDDLEAMIGEKLTAVVQELERKSKRVVLSRRAYLQHKREQAREKLMAELAVDQVREGVVSRVMDFGAFVDLGGVDGLVHVSDLSHGHVAKTSEVVKAGDKVKVVVLRIDLEKDRISLGMKQIEPDPWEQVAGTVHAGEEVTGRVVRTANFGAFVEVMEGVEGLLPISEISWKRIHRVQDVLKDGDVVRLKVLSVDPGQKKMSLSLKQAQPDPWELAAEHFGRDMMVQGRVVSITDFGAFVELDHGIEGMIHISELTDRRVENVEEILKVGDEREYRILECNSEQRRIKLSLKAPRQDRAEQGDRENRAQASAPAGKAPKALRKAKGPLKSGLGSHGGLGMGLGDLKL